jgi:NAD(P)-dependent dehydrogenase (short-subunit alcohol dehydrogenase family)
MRLAAHCAVVTGGGRNVGEAIALQLVEEGARVAVVDIDPAAAERTAKKLNALRPGSGVALTCDVSHPAEVQRMAGEAWEALGAVNILVNSVAITDRGRTILDLPDELWSRVLDISLGGTFLCCKYLAQRMVEAGNGGSIVNIGSTSGHQPRANALAYPTAKAALYGLSKSIALQLGEHRIRVNCVTPNKVGSPVGQAEEGRKRPLRNLVGRGCTPEDIAKAVAFMVSPDASFITGVDLVVDGGALVSASMD